MYSVTTQGGQCGLAGPGGSSASAIFRSVLAAWRLVIESASLHAVGNIAYNGWPCQRKRL